MARVQGTSATTGSTNTNTLTSPALTITAGNMVTVSCVISTGGNPFGTFSSSKSDSFTNINSQATSGVGSVNMATIASAVGGSTTFTITVSGVNSNFMSIFVEEFSGRAGTIETFASAFSSSFVTSHSSPTTGTGAGGAGGSVAISAGSDVVAHISDATNAGSLQTYTATGGWTIEAATEQLTVVSAPGGMVMYQNNPGSAIYTATYTSGVSVKSGNFIFGLPAASVAVPIGVILT